MEVRTRKPIWYVLPLLLLSLVSPIANAQAPPLPAPVTATNGFMAFELQPEETFRWMSIANTGKGPAGVGIASQAEFPFTITDISYENDQQNPVYHRFEVRVDWLGGVRPEGWVFQDLTNIVPTSVRGNTFSQSVILQIDPSKTPNKTATLQVTVTMQSAYGANDLKVVKTENFTGMIYPSPALLMQVVYEGEPGDGGTPLLATPDTLIPIVVNVTNADLYLQRIVVSVTVEPSENVDPEKIAIIGAGIYVLQPSESQTIRMQLLTPKETTWYRSVPLSYTVRAASAENPSIGISSNPVIIIEGWYIGTPILVLIPLLLILVILFILVLLLAKRYYDENILGKPIPPWRIPEEAEALETLRKTDPRQFYITRYFLMVEEYESALNWFYGYKARTKKTLKREARSSQLADRAAMLKTPNTDRFDVRADRIKRRMRRKQERRRLQLEAKISRLHEKLEKHYEEDFEKDHQKWEKNVEKLKAKANRPWFRARKKWEREVERALEAWEKPFAKDKAKREKEIAKAKDKYAAVVKKKDKETWHEWREAVEANEKENRIREKEGRDPLPEPALLSEVVGPPEIPKPFKEPPKPKLPPEPKEPVVEGLPPEPTLALPKLEESHYKRKARRTRKKSDRKVRRLERKMERMLAKNERDRVKSISRANKKREKLLRKSHKVVQPTLMERLFRNTPENRERRAHKKLLKALASERVKTVEESERARLEVLEVDAKRREAEILARLVRQQAEVRKSGGAATMRAEQAPELLELRETNQAKIQREKLAAKKRVEAEKAKAEEDLRRQLTEELVKERAERERLQAQKAAAILARAERKAAFKAEKAEAEDEPEPEAAPPVEKAPKTPRPKRAKK